MKINILPLLRGEKAYIPFSFTADMTGITEDITCGEYEATGKLSDFSGYMLLEGTVSMVFNAVCGRCGKNTEHKINTQFSRPVAQKLTEEDDEYIIAAENGDVDIDEAVSEAVYMEMPVRFLCKESCKGLCPVCGADLNDTSCSCVTKEVDPRLAKLREYLESIEETQE